MAYDNQPSWNSKNCAASTDLIEKCFCQILGTDGYAYLMHMNVCILPQSISSDVTLEAKLFNNKMIETYPIIKLTEHLENIVPPDKELSLKMYSCKAVEDIYAAFGNWGAGDQGQGICG